MKALELLGKKVEDKVTGFKGIVSSISFDLYGCIQAAITPQITEKEPEPRSGGWFDIVRLKVLSKKPVIELPDFIKAAGPAPKPPSTRF